jgi:uncharacterized protein
MAAGPPDLVDCVQLAGDGAVLERSYALEELPRLADLLASPRGVVQARFVFSKLPSGRPGARVDVRAEPWLRCQRCMRGFEGTVSGGSQVEFAADESVRASDEEREVFRADGGRVSLKDLAEEEVLLALPMVPACEAPEGCGNAPRLGGGERVERADPMRRPFGGLEELLKKRDRT